MSSNVEELVIAKVKALVPEQQKVVLKFVETLERDAAAEVESFALDGQTIWDEIELLSRQVSPEEWAKVPPDLSENIDHYLYGSPKKK